MNEFRESKRIIANIERDIDNGLAKMALDDVQAREIVVIRGHAFATTSYARSFALYVDQWAIIFVSGYDVYSFPLHPCKGEDVYQGFLETPELDILNDTAGKVRAPEGYAFYGDSQADILGQAVWALRTTKHAIREAALSKVY